MLSLSEDWQSTVTAALVGVQGDRLHRLNDWRASMNLLGTNLNDLAPTTIIRLLGDTSLSQAGFISNMIIIQEKGFLLSDRQRGGRGPKGALMGHGRRGR